MIIIRNGLVGAQCLHLPVYKVTILYLGIVIECALKVAALYQKLVLASVPHILLKLLGECPLWLSKSLPDVGFFELLETAEPLLHDQVDIEGVMGDVLVY